jgi:polar amino acid transport system substrate-binding protein
MLQVLQHQSSGEILVEDMPLPQCVKGGVLVHVHNSLISAGTERASVAKAQSSLLERALKQPQEVKKVLDSVQKDGLAATLRKVQGVLDSYKPLGYSAAGVVTESCCMEFSPGDRVACAGNMYAFHAEHISVPKNLVVKVPDGVSFEEASITTLGAIAMQGIRQAQPELGATVAVIGLGLLGQLTVQLLKANGCRVIGLDVNPALFATAQKFGADLVLPSTTPNIVDATKAIQGFTRGTGVDAVIITAATDSNAPVELAIDITRKRGSVVVVGAVGMNIPRSPFYEKELRFTISCSYGAGRYDPVYEEQGIDYPIGYVRWTEQRNMQAFLDLVAARKLDVNAMITHRFPVQQAAEAYRLITGDTTSLREPSGEASGEPRGAIVLEYPRTEREHPRRIQIHQRQTSRHHAHSSVCVGVVGAGNFAQASLLPPLQRERVRLKTLITTKPVTAKSAAERFAFEGYATSAEEVFADAEVNLVVCASRHDSHADYVIEALKRGKHVFVEKPLAISREQLERIDAELAAQANPAHVMVGFNRRFSAPLRAMKDFFLGRTEPLAMLYRVNAGAIAPEHWIQDAAQGGRIIGECCHFVDCMAFLTDASPVHVFAETISTPNSNAQHHDTVSISLKFSDGSIGTVHYYANGNSNVGKEYCEVFGSGKTAQMDNFSTVALASGKRTTRRSFDGSKGHAEEIAEVVRSVRTGSPMPIAYHTLRAVTLATFAAEESLQTGLPVAVR